MKDVKLQFITFNQLVQFIWLHGRVEHRFQIFRVEQVSVSIFFVCVPLCK